MVWSVKGLTRLVYIHNVVRAVIPILSPLFQMVSYLASPVVSILMDGFHVLYVGFVVTPLVGWVGSIPFHVLFPIGKRLVVGAVRYLLAFGQLSPVAKLLLGIFDLAVLMGFFLFFLQKKKKRPEQQFLDRMFSMM